jgi:hypothetical protein
MLPFFLRMVETRVTGIQFQVAAPFLICHDDQMVHKADTALYIMDAGDSCPLSKLDKAFTCNREVLLHHTHTTGSHGMVITTRLVSPTPQKKTAHIFCLRWHYVTINLYH